MHTKLLLPNKFKNTGWAIFIISFILGLFILIGNFESQWLNGKMIEIYPALSNKKVFDIVEVNFTNTIVGLALIIGGLLVAFSKEKIEDEFITNLRLSSLLWAVLINYILLALAFLFIYGFSFFDVMVFNMFTVLVIFIARFNYILYRNSKKLSNAE